MIFVYFSSSTCYVQQQQQLVVFNTARASLQIPWEAQGNVNGPRGK